MRQDDLPVSLSLTFLTIVIAVILYAVINYFISNAFASAVIAIIVVMIGVMTFIGKQMIGWTILGIIGAAIVVALWIGHIEAIAMAVVGICLLVIGAMIMKA